MMVLSLWFLNLAVAAALVVFLCQNRRSRRDHKPRKQADEGQKE